MKRVDVSEYGVPEEVAACVEVEDVGQPDDGEVVFDVIAFPINPADLGFCRGTYRLRPALPATPGAECVGRVSAVGKDVSKVVPGDLVINLQRENWAQRRRVSAADVIRLPADIDLQQATMLRINPPTALLLLEDVVSLDSEDWIIQNTSNSAVGRLVVRLAQTKGLRTVNVTRRSDVFEDLKSLGGDVCLEDGHDLADRVREATDGAGIRLGLDAIAGDATGRMAACLCDGGTVCTYGGLSGKPPNVGTPDIINRGIKLSGFLLGRFLEKKTADKIQEIYDTLAAELLAGKLHSQIERIYPIEEIQQALIHAQQGGRNGKILVSPNGEL